MILRSLTTDDTSLAPDWLRGRRMLPDRWRDEHTRTLIAEDGAGEPIGAATMWTSPVHPDRYSVDLVVAPDHRRAGIATALLEALTELQPEPKRFIWGAAETDPAHGFAATFGARTIQRAPLDTFQTSRAVRLRPPDDIASAAAVSRVALEQAWVDMYEWTHADWHPVEPDTRAALVEDLWDEIDPHLSSIAVSATGAIDAVLLVFIDGGQPVVAGETVSRDTPGRHATARGLRASNVQPVGRRGVRRNPARRPRDRSPLCATVRCFGAGHALAPHRRVPPLTSLTPKSCAHERPTAEWPPAVRRRPHNGAARTAEPVRALRAPPVAPHPG
ncbi:acetyltransferase, GNAT family [Microcella alkaliphila]|uniref:Acetyltransferase, GNAT family n=1 Tax=Microcella alkaliphila TaxID=279828 RepID=A0A0U4WV16_9MICO|nr:acetyltransferase, GNAT family [Microcella alkaliphila]